MNNHSPGPLQSVMNVQLACAVMLGMDAVLYAIKFGPASALGWLLGMYAICRWARWEASQ